MMKRADLKPRYYHTSGARLRVGDVIGGDGQLVFLHTTPIPHWTIVNMVLSGFSSWSEYKNSTVEARPDGKSKSWVYEVRPRIVKGKKAKIEDLGGELVCDSAPIEIIRVVGNAKGILENHIRKFGDKWDKFGLFSHIKKK